eukprot:scaffold2109_cov111-Skeletonema_dohrnii-CCMP3373.AAC.5
MGSELPHSPCLVIRRREKRRRQCNTYKCKSQEEIPGKCDARARIVTKKLQDGAPAPHHTTFDAALPR